MTVTTQHPHDEPPNALPHVTAAALFVDASGRLLLARLAGTPRWELPGGAVRLEEAPLAGCRRLISDQLQLDARIQRVLAIDWAPSAIEGDRLHFIFDGGVLDPADHGRLRTSDEAFGFHAAERLEGLMLSRARRRLEAAIAARRHGGIEILEHGASPSTEKTP